MDDQKNPMSELYKAVAVLTQPHPVIIDDREGNFLGSREEQALIGKLRAARAANVGGKGGAGALARERVPINVAAIDLYDRIVGEIREWYGHETDYGDGDMFRLPESALRQWFLRYSNRWRAKQISDDYAWERVRTVQAWITQTRDLLDPPFRFPLTAPCPACGEAWIESFATDDPNETERVRVLNAVERENMDDSYVMCRSCERVWRGALAARSLRIAIDDAEAARQTEGAA